MKQTIANVLDDSDRAALLHPFTDFAAHKSTGGRAFVAAEHIYLTDAEGKGYIDGMSGLWCVNLGYSQPKIVRAVTEQLERLPYYNSFFNCTTDTTIEMATRLTAVLPEGFNHVFFTNSGSEANDTNIRLVHRYFDLIGQPHRKLIISRKNAYHGSTIAAASLGGMSGMHKQFTGLPYVHHIEQPYAFENAGELDEAAYGKAAAQCLADKIDEPRRGPRRRLHRRARPGRRRRDHPTAKLPGRSGPNLRRARGAADQRRGHLRLRADRRVVSAARPTACSQT